jgi:hypothetical protein
MSILETRSGAGGTDPAARRSSQGGPIDERREEEKEAGAAVHVLQLPIRALTLRKMGVRYW